MSDAGAQFGSFVDGDACCTKTSGSIGAPDATITWSTRPMMPAWSSSPTMPDDRGMLTAGGDSSDQPSEPALSEATDGARAGTPSSAGESSILT